MNYWEIVKKSEPECFDDFLWLKIAVLSIFFFLVTVIFLIPTFLILFFALGKGFIESNIIAILLLGIPFLMYIISTHIITSIRLIETTDLKESIIYGFKNSLKPFLGFIYFSIVGMALAGLPFLAYSLIPNTDILTIVQILITLLSAIAILLLVIPFNITFFIFVLEEERSFIRNIKQVKSILSRNIFYIIGFVALLVLFLITINTALISIDSNGLVLQFTNLLLLGPFSNVLTFNLYKVVRDRKL